MTARTSDRAIAALPSVIRRALERRPELNATAWREFDCAYPYWVMFFKYRLDDPGQHTYNGTAREIAAAIRDAVPCECDECRSVR